MPEKIKPSSEQEHILSLAEAGKSIVGIARAGAAKTTTARWAIQNRSHTLKNGKRYWFGLLTLKLKLICRLTLIKMA